MFELQPEFIELDHRQNRPAGAYGSSDTGKLFGYNITTDFMNRRHALMLPPDLVKGKTVLDVGSCLGATGAWCLYHGAAHYTGVEIQQTYIDLSSRLLSKYHAPEKFSIQNQTAESLQFDSKFDIIVASGVLYSVFDPFALIKSLSGLAREQIIIESKHPYRGFRRLFGFDANIDMLKDRAKKLPMIVPNDSNYMTHADSEVFVHVASSNVSVPALALLFQNHGWEHDWTLYHAAEREIPWVYDLAQCDRYMTRFVPNDSCSVRHFYKEIHNPNAITVPWNKV